MTRIETSTIGGTGMKESTTTSGLSRIIAMAATIADSTAISKGHIGSGAIATTTITIVTATIIMTATMIVTGTKRMNRHGDSLDEGPRGEFGERLWQYLWERRGTRHWSALSLLV